jgi:hypothetical protein
MNKNMKKGLFFLLGMFMGYMNMAQVPHTFSYQMVIRNGNNELVAKQRIMFGLMLQTVLVRRMEMRYRL